MAQGASSAPPTGSIVTSIPIRTIKGLARRCRTPAAFNGHKYTNDPPVNGDQRRASLLSLFLLLGISDAEAAPQARSKTYATIVFALSLLKGAKIKAAQCTRGVRRRVHARTYVSYGEMMQGHGPTRHAHKTRHTHTRHDTRTHICGTGFAPGATRVGSMRALERLELAPVPFAMQMVPVTRVEGTAAIPAHAPPPDMAHGRHET